MDIQSNTVSQLQNRKLYKPQIQRSFPALSSIRLLLVFVYAIARSYAHRWPPCEHPGLLGLIIVSVHVPVSNQETLARRTIEGQGGMQTAGERPKICTY